MRVEPPQILVARGEQEVACMRRINGRFVPAEIPTALSKGFDAFFGTDWREGVVDAPRT